MVAESDFRNGHAVLEPVGSGRLPREKMVYMAVKDASQGEEDISEFAVSFFFFFLRRITCAYSNSKMCFCYTLS